MKHILLFLLLLFITIAWQPLYGQTTTSNYSNTWNTPKPLIASSTLRLTSPNGGEKLVIGSNTLITWEGVSASDTVSLEYSIDNGISWKSITTKATGLQYNWKNIPQPPSNQCLVRIKLQYCPTDSNNYVIPNIEWQKTFGGTGDDYAHSVMETMDGGYIVAGNTTTNNDGDVSINKGGSDFWVVKFTGNGSIEWQKTFGGADSENAYTIKSTRDGGYIVAGTTKSKDGDVNDFKGFTDAWILKLSSSGIIEWQKTLGGTDYDGVNSIQQTIDGGYIVAAYTHSNNGDVIGFKGFVDFWIIKLGASGILEWQKTLGGSDGDIPYCISQTADSGYILAGRTESDNGDINRQIRGTADFWIVKINSRGTIEWQISPGGGDWDEAKSVEQTKDGGYILVGSVISNDGDIPSIYGHFDYVVLKLSKDGKIEWQKVLGGSKYDAAYAIQVTCEGGYIITGCTSSNEYEVSGNHGKNDFWIVKLNEFGTIRWRKTLGGSGDDLARSIQQTSDGGYVVVGYTTSNDGDITNNKGKTDCWIVKLSPESAVTDVDVSDAVFSIIYPPITINAGNVEGYVSNYTEIPLFIDESTELKNIMIKAVSVELAINKTLLLPIDTTNCYEDGNLLIIKIDSLMLPVDGNREITRIRCITAQGNAEQTDLVLRNVKPLGGLANITTVNGMFKLLGVCKEGGTRLLNPTSQTAILSITPNPAAETIRIQYKNADEGSAEFRLIDVLGQVVSTTLLSKTQQGNVQIDIRTIPSGLYFGVFTTGSIQTNVLVNIMK